MMKVLDPQCALLTNAEVQQFLKSKPARKPEEVVGAYPQTNFTGLDTVLKDVSQARPHMSSTTIARIASTLTGRKFNTYSDEITPHVTNQPPLDKWITVLIKKLKPYELTKTEVMNLINMGVGLRTPAQQGQVNGETNGESGEPDEDVEMARDVQFFKVAVEEAEERFSDDVGEERIREVVAIMKECIHAPRSD